MNQTASEIAKEYETMAIKAANEHYRLKCRFHDSPALEAHVRFCTSMQITWNEIAQKLESKNIFGANDDMNDRWGLCD